MFLRSNLNKDQTNKLPAVVVCYHQPHLRKTSIKTMPSLLPFLYEWFWQLRVYVLHTGN